MSSAQWGLLGALCGVLFAAGGWLVLAGWRGTDPARPQRASALARRWRRARADLPEGWARNYRWVAVAAGTAMLAGWWVTARPVHGLLAGAVVAAGPWIWHPGGSATKRQIDRLEALAEWLQLLASGYSSGSTLEHAIEGSVPSAPERIRPAVAQLAARLREDVDPRRAYRWFADELADGAVDHVVKVFLTHTAQRGRGLTETLQGLSRYTARQAKALRAVDTDRAKVRSSARWVAVISLGTALVLVNMTSYGQAYRTAAGQGVLLVLGVLFALTLMWLRRMSATPPTPRGLRPLAEADRQAAARAARYQVQAPPVAATGSGGER